MNITKKHIIGLASIVCTGVLGLIVLVDHVQTVRAQSNNWQPPAGTPLANKEHPRLYFTASSLPAVKSRILQHYKPEFQSFVTQLDGVFNESAASQDRRDLLHDTRNYAFLCAVLKEPMSGISTGHSRGQYCDKAIEYGLQIGNTDYTDARHDSQNWVSTKGGLVNLSLALSYDWTYDYSSLSQKQQLANIMINKFNGRDDDAKPPHDDRGFLNNQVTTPTHSGTINPLAFWGDPLGSSIENKAQEMLNYFNQAFHHGMLDVGEIVCEGGFCSQEGSSYSWDVGGSLPYIAGPASTALDTNYFARDHIRTLPLWTYFMRLPKSVNGSWFSQTHDTGGPGNNELDVNCVAIDDCWDVPRRFMNIMAYNLKDDDPTMAAFASWFVQESPYAADISNYRYAQSGFPDRRWRLFENFLGGTAGVPPKSPDELGIDLMYRAGERTVLRSSFDEENATRLSIESPQYYFCGGHNMIDPSAIQLAKYGNLLVKNVNSKSDNYCPRTSGSGKWPSFANITSVYTDAEMEFPLDVPRDCPLSAADLNNPDYRIGTLNAHETHSNLGFDYFSYDYSKAYNDTPGLVSSARQDIVYVRGGDNSEYFVERNRINSSTQKMKILHFAADVTPDNASSIASASRFKVVNNFKEAHGQLYVHSLLPNDASFQKYSGGWTDASGNHPDSGLTDMCRYLTGDTTIHIKSNNGVYLTVYEPGNSNSMGSAAPTKLVDAGNMEGAVIDNEWVVLFAKGTNVLSSTGYTINTSKDSVHIVTGFAPNNRYSVSTGSNSFQVTATSEGTLRFQDTNTGSHTISIGGGTPPVADTEKPVVSSFNVQPRETETNTTFSWSVTDNTSLARVEIWRAPYTNGGCDESSTQSCDWGKVHTELASGTSDSRSVTLTPTEGTSLYGLHAIDQAGNIGYEPQAIKVTKTVTQSNIPPQAVASADPKSGAMPLTVHFTGSNSSDSDGTIIAYNWSFGDGAGSSQSNPSHTYQGAGGYDAILTVTDNDGATGQAFIDIEVEDTTPPPPPPGDAVYVDNSVAQSGNGSKTSPYKTIQEGLNSLVGSLNVGQTVYVRGDTSGSGRVYAEHIDTSGDGSAQTPYTLAAYENERVIIEDSQTISFGDDYWNITGISFDHKGASNDAIRVSGEYVNFDSVTLSNGARDGFEIRSAARNVTIRNSTIHNFVWQPGSDAHCIVVNSGMESLLVDNNTIYDCGGDGIQLFAESGDDPETYSRDVSLTNNTFYTTLGSNSENAIDVKGVIGMTVKDNEIYGFEDKAIVLQKGPQDVRITHNSIHDSHRGIEVRGEGGFYPINIDIINNVIYDIYGQYALKFDQVENLKAQHNTLVGITGNPFLIEEEGVISGYIQNNLTSTSGNNKVSGTNNALVSHNGWVNGVSAGPLSGSNDVTGSSASFVNEGSRALDLQSGSVAIDRGKNLTHVVDDYVHRGRPTGAAPDLGAYEFQSGGTPPRPEIYVTLSVDKASARIGDTLTYSLAYNNPSVFSAYNVVLEDAIPDHTALVANSITGGGVYVDSVDLVKWQLAHVGAGEFGTVQFKVVVLDPSDPVPPTPPAPPTPPTPVPPGDGVLFNEDFEGATTFADPALAGSASYIDSTVAYSGNRSLNMCAGNECKFSYRQSLSRSADEMYARYMFKVGNHQNWYDSSGNPLTGEHYKNLGLEGGDTSCKGGGSHDDASCVTVRTRLLNPHYGVVMEGYAAPEHEAENYVDRSINVVDGEWHCIEEKVKLNTPGRSDGEVRYWVDGKESVVSNLNFRESQNWQIGTYWWTYWSNDNWTGPTYVDDVVVSTSRIGCPDTPPPPTPPTPPVPPSPPSPPADTTAPVVSQFSALPQTTESVTTINWSVRDNTELDRVEIWRAPYNSGCSENNTSQCSWAMYERVQVDGTSDARSVTLTFPVGKHWLGLHVVDAVGNIGYEPSPPGSILIAREETTTPPSGNEKLEPFGTVTVTPDFDIDGQGENIDSVAFWEADNPSQTLMFVTGKSNSLVEVWEYPFVNNEKDPITDISVNGVIVDQKTNRLHVAGGDRVTEFTIPALQELREYGQVGSGETNIDLLDMPNGTTRTYVTESHAVRAFSTASGADTGIRIVPPVSSIETVLADDYHQLIHIPEEQGPDGNPGIYVYKADGSVHNQNNTNIYGTTQFEADAEGIALYKCMANGEDTGSGFILVSDQRGGLNDYEIFHRRTWKHLGALRLQGVGNTDGIGSTQKPLPAYPQGLFAAVNDDDTVAGVGWGTILNATGLSCGSGGTPPTPPPGPPADTTPPAISQFTVQPQSTESSVTVSWTVRDNTALDRVEIWRAPYAGNGCSDTNKTQCSWSEISRKNVSGTTHSGSYIDNPAVGTHWYGLHVFDASDNMTLESSPIKVVKEDSPTPPPTSPPPGPAPGPSAQCPAPNERGGVVATVASDVPDLIGASTKRILAYQYSSGSWTRVPVQVDEREKFALWTLYVTPSALTDSVWQNDEHGVDDEGANIVDANDEIAFAYKSLAGQAPNNAAQPSGVTNARIQVAVTDPANGTTGYVYLFVAQQDVSRLSNTGISYTRSEFPCPYDDSGDVCEDTKVQASCYSTHFSNSWVQDDYKVTSAANGSNQDILDRWHGFAYAPGRNAAFVTSFGEHEDNRKRVPGACGWSEQNGEHYYIGHKTGPVRAIRQIRGACSFPDLIRIFKYAPDEAYESIIFRGHGFGGQTGGIGMIYDHHAAAGPLTYYSASLPQGIKLDGQKDFPGVNVAPITPAQTAAGIWFQVSGPRGGWLMHVEQTQAFQDPSENELMLYMDDNRNFNDGTGSERGLIGGYGFRYLSLQNTETVAKPPQFETVIRPIGNNLSNQGAAFKAMLDKAPVVNIQKVR